MSTKQIMADEVSVQAIFKAKLREIDPTPTVQYLYVPGARDTEIWLQGFPQHLRECYERVYTELAAESRQSAAKPLLSSRNNLATPSASGGRSGNHSSRRAVIHSNSRSGYDLNTRDTGLTGGEYSGTGSGLAGTTGAGYDSTARDTGSGLLGGDSVLGSGTGPDASPSIQEKNAQSTFDMLEEVIKANVDKLSPNQVQKLRGYLE